jgi:hypothetical protein
MQRLLKREARGLVVRRNLRRAFGASRAIGSIRATRRRRAFDSCASRSSTQIAALPRQSSRSAASVSKLQKVVACPGDSLAAGARIVEEIMSNRNRYAESSSGSVKTTARGKIWKLLSKHAHLVVALTIAVGSFFESPGIAQAEYVTEQGAPLTLDVGGGTQRVSETTYGCLPSCVKEVPLPFNPYAPGIHFYCAQYSSYANSCDPTSSALYASSADFASGTIFSAYEDPTWSYFGCGPQAAQNVLNYYGVQMPIAEVAQYISTFGLIAGDQNQSIATFPDSLASGLQNLLNDQVAANHFAVARRSGVAPSIEIENAINGGTPIILLVDGGYHYQVATGYNLGGYYVIDYPSAVTSEGNRWRTESDLGMGLSTGMTFLSDAIIGYGGFSDDTIVTTEYINGGVIYDPPNSQAAATECNVGGYWMHCCPSGYAMVGADPNSNVFKCAAMDAPRILGGPTLDTGTQRNNMHSCPYGQVMVGLRVDWNLLACQALPGGSVTDERVDSSTLDTYPMHTCDSGNPTGAMDGIRVDWNQLSCATTVRVHN